jgi:hypothetical protein
MPTVGDRLKRRLIVLSDDAGLPREVAQLLPSGWDITTELGEFHEVLLHRFVIVDLDAPDAVGAVRRIRSEMNLNVPVFCVGGDAAARDAARLARADRFFGRDELSSMLPQFCESFGW